MCSGNNVGEIRESLSLRIGPRRFPRNEIIISVTRTSSKLLFPLHVYRIRWDSREREIKKPSRGFESRHEQRRLNH